MGVYLSVYHKGCATFTIPPSTMSSTSTTSNFQDILEAALELYTKKTGKDLCDLPADHPLVELDSCNSPDSIIVIFQEQARKFGEFRKGNTKLLQWLKPIVKVLHTLSTNKVLGDYATNVNPATTHYSHLSALTLIRRVIPRCFHMQRQSSPPSNSFYPCVSPSSPPDFPSHTELSEDQGRGQKLRFSS